MVSSSSLVGQNFAGQSGRKYVRTEELRSDTSQYWRSIYVAESEGRTYILKRVSRHAYKKCQTLHTKFASSRYLRLHVDENEEEQTLVYDYFRGNLFDFMNAHNQLPPLATIYQIMWETGKALEELHCQKVMHVDVKPDNILLDWTETPLPNGAVGSPTLGKVVLSDLDSAFDIGIKGAWSLYPTSDHRDVRFGNIRWRAPEMQTGMGIGLFSDVFAYALTYIYTLIGQVPLGMEDYDEIARQTNMQPEELALAKTIEYFGPVTPEFMKHTRDENWQNTIRVLEELVNENYEPQNNFEAWTHEDFPRLFPSVKEMLSGMVKLGPGERLTMRQIMDHHSWNDQIVRDGYR